MDFRIACAWRRGATTSCRSTDVKLVRLARWRLDLSVHRLDACSAGAAPQFVLQPVDSFGVAFGPHFDASVRQISDPSAQPFEPRRPFDEETEPQDAFLEDDEELEPLNTGAPPAPKTNTQQEAGYLRRLIEGNVPVSVKVRNGDVFQGVIEYYDQRFIRLTREGQPNLFIFKKDILYLSEA